MADIQQDIVGNINGLVIAYFAKGVKKLSIKKLINYILKKYNIKVDAEYVNEILSNNPHVNDIVEDKIILSSPSDKQGIEDNNESNALDNVESKASEQALDNITSEGKFLKFNSSEVMLNENDKDYFIHKGSLKNKRNYIAEKLDKDILYCKIENSKLKIEIPVERLSENVKQVMNKIVKK